MRSRSVGRQPQRNSFDDATIAVLWSIGSRPTNPPPVRDDGFFFAIEVDPGLSEQAAKNLAAAGYDPCLVVGDGVRGFAEDGPYDRVQAACAVAGVPYAWVEQTRPGGIVAALFSPGYGYGWLACLHVMGDGSALDSPVRVLTPDGE